MPSVRINTGKAYTSEKITVSSTAIGFTASNVVHASNGSIHPIRAEFSVEDADIRVKTDGSDPDGDTGILIKDGSVIAINGESDIVNFKAIRDATTDAIINVQYYKD